MGSRISIIEEIKLKKKKYAENWKLIGTNFLFEIHGFDSLID